VQGRTATFSTFSDARFDEANVRSAANGDRMPLMICFYWILKLKARFLSGDYAEALRRQVARAAAHRSPSGCAPRLRPTPCRPIRALARSRSGDHGHSRTPLHHAAIEWGARACIERGIDQLGVDLMVWPYPRLTIVAVRLLTARIWTNLSKWQQSRLSLARSTTIAAGSDQK
jgi:hypothetical protein